MKEKNRKEKPERSRHPVKNNIYLLSVLWKIAPGRVISQFIVRFIITGVWVFSSLIFMQYFFGSGKLDRSFSEAVIFLIFALMLSLLREAYSSWHYDRYSLISDQRIIRELYLMLFEKAGNVDMGCYDNTEFFNSYTKAASELVEKSQDVLEKCADILSNILSIIVVVVWLLKISPIIGLIAMIPALSILLFGRLSSKVSF